MKRRGDGEEDGEMEKEGENGKDDKSKRTECICVF